MIVTKVKEKIILQSFSKNNFNLAKIIQQNIVCLLDLIVKSNSPFFFPIIVAYYYMYIIYSH